MISRSWCLPVAAPPCAIAWMLASGTLLCKYVLRLVGQIDGIVGFGRGVRGVGDAHAEEDLSKVTLRSSK